VFAPLPPPPPGAAASGRPADAAAPGGTMSRYAARRRGEDKVRRNTLKYYEIVDREYLFMHK